MLKKFLNIATFFLWISLASGQYNILEHPEILPLVKECQIATYGYDFEKAKELREILYERIPDHPVPHFLKALIIYWENYPLLPGDSKVDDFIQSMENTISCAEHMTELDPQNLEGIFFDMHGRAYITMFWADNGQSSKAIPGLSKLYRQTLKGIELKDLYNEFYFSAGLYNYYIEAYMDEHPVYKPFAALFRKGDRQLGLLQLEYASRNTTYLKYESMQFMSLLYMHYEMDFNVSEKYAAQLHEQFPKNIYYLGRYAIVLLYEKKFKEAESLIAHLSGCNSAYENIIYHMTQGIIQENLYKNYNLSALHYNKAVLLADGMGAIANNYCAICYAGLSRLEDMQGENSQARHYARRSKQKSGFEYILKF